MRRRHGSAPRGSDAGAARSGNRNRLTPDKNEAFDEVFRILKPGGQFLYGDIIVASELSESIRRNIDLWSG
jgi:ubiquinone/menaquinone biosynthesis C-methylase UbiE